jgi:hypothetical protein
MQRHIRPCQFAESERTQSARHPVRIAGRRDGPSVRASLMLTGYGGRQCPPCSAHCLSFQPSINVLRLLTAVANDIFPNDLQIIVKQVWMRNCSVIEQNFSFGVKEYIAWVSQSDSKLLIAGD